MRKLRPLKDTIKFKDASSLVRAVVGEHFSNLVRLSEARTETEVFRALADKVGTLNQSLMAVKPVTGDVVTEEDRQNTLTAFSEIEAQTLKMKALEQQASSLASHLINVKEKISSFTAQTLN